MFRQRLGHAVQRVKAIRSVHRKIQTRGEVLEGRVILSSLTLLLSSTSFHNGNASSMQIFKILFFLGFQVFSM